MKRQSLEKMNSVVWTYADKDPVSLQVLEDKIALNGMKRQMITYSKLVGGVDFLLPNIRKGEAYRKNTNSWSGLDRAIIGEFLGQISIRSNKRAGFMASAPVVGNAQMTPSSYFCEWMETLGILPDLSGKTILEFCSEQVRKAPL